MHIPFYITLFFVSLASFTDQILTVLSIAQIGPAAGHVKIIFTTASSRCPGKAFWVSGGTRAVRSGRDLCSPRRRQRTGQNSEDLKPENEEVIHLEYFSTGLDIKTEIAYLLGNICITQGELC